MYVIHIGTIKGINILPSSTSSTDLISKSVGIKQWNIGELLVNNLDMHLCNIGIINGHMIEPISTHNMSEILENVAI